MNPFKQCGKFLQYAASVSMVLGCANLVKADGDWPQWRGPKRDNVSTEKGLLQDWPPEGPKLLWKATGIGVGFSSVSVANGRIYTMGDHGDVGDVEALDLDGKHLWTTNIGKSGGNYAGTRCTPTADGDLIYALGQFGDLVCIEAVTGKLVWHKEFRSKEISGAMGGWNYTESPLVDGDKVICVPGGKLGTVAAFNKKTGDLLWRSTDLTDGAQYSSLVPAEIAGVHQYVVFTGASVAGIAADGKVLWHAERKGKTAMIATPVVADDLVFVTSGYGVGCNCFKITKTGDKFDAKEIYNNTDMKVHHGGVIRLGEFIYGSNDPGLLTCMTIKDGKVVWKERSVGKGSLAYADGRLYLRAEGSGDVALVEAFPAGYKEHGILKQPERGKERAWPHPIIAGGRLYLRDQDNLFCYDIKGK